MKTAASPKLLVLGSAAAEGIPAIYCECALCRKARRLGGRDLRRRTSYNFGGCVQIDTGPDFLQAWHRHPDEMSQIRHILVTHAHGDHFTVNEFFYHGQGFASVPRPGGVLSIHGTSRTFRRFLDYAASTWTVSLDEKMRRAGIAFHEFKRFGDFTLDDCDARVRIFAADHDPLFEPCVILVTMHGRTVFICNDTGWLPDESWAALSALRGEVLIDVAVLDNTGMLCGTAESPVPGEVWRKNHMSAPTVLATFDKLNEIGLLDKDCIRVVNHFSHNGGCTHDQLRAYYEPRGILVGYDDMEL